MSLSRFLISMGSMVLLGGGAGVGFAQDYPSKPIHLLTGGAGGSSDALTRLLAAKVFIPMGQAAVVENRTTAVAAEAIAKAAPDGYTLLVQGGGVWILPLFQPAAWDPERDFATITVISRDVLALAVHPSVPAKSIKEFIAYAKSRPGVLNYAVGQAGATGTIAGDLFNSLAGTNMVRIPHVTGPQQFTALLANTVQMLVSDAGLIMPLAKAGKVTALGVTTTQPSTLFPDLPTIAGSGLPGYEWIGMTGMFAPAKTPTAIINKLNQDTVRWLRTADAKAEFTKMGIEVADSTPEQFSAMVKSDRAKTTKLIQETTGVKAN